MKNGIKIGKHTLHETCRKLVRKRKLPTEENKKTTLVMRVKSQKHIFIFRRHSCSAETLAKHTNLFSVGPILNF